MPARSSSDACAVPTPRTVGWEIGTDPSFGPGTILAAGTETTAAASDHTAHVEVDTLPSGATLWYRFTVEGTTSPVGRTKTLPAGSVDRVRIAYFSCQRYVHGYYSSHADLAPSSGELLGTSSVDEPEMVEAGRTMLGPPRRHG